MFSSVFCPAFSFERVRHLVRMLFVFDVRVRLCSCSCSDLLFSSVFRSHARADVECQCRMPMSNANVECQCRMSMSNANVECQCRMPMSNANVECQ